MRTISDPARSTKNSFPVFTVRSEVFLAARLIMQMAWLLLLSTFIEVPDTWRLCDPVSKIFSSSRSLLTTISVAPSMYTPRCPK